VNHPLHGKRLAAAARPAWPPVRMLGRAPDLDTIHTPVWTAHLDRQEAARALHAAHQDLRLISEQDFPVPLCSRMARRVFDLMSADCSYDIQATVEHAHRLIAARLNGSQAGPMAAYAWMTVRHVHRSYWNGNGSEPGLLFRVKNMLPAAYDEIVALDGRAGPWLDQTIMRLRYM
jgi:hypothetical protein